MYTFVPQLLVILSLVGIILIVVRRTPELRFPVPVHLKNAEHFVATWVKFGARKLWHFVLSAKEMSRKTEAYLPKRLLKLHLPTASRFHLPSFARGEEGGGDVLVEQGVKALAEGDQGAAEENFINAIKKDPTSEPAFAGLGRLYLAQNKTKEAIETFKFLLKHYPSKAIYSASLAQAYYNQHEFDPAISALERAIELEPSNAKHFLNVAMVLESKNHLEEAILNYRRAVELNSEDTQIMLKLCDALIKKGDKPEAEQLLQNLLLQEPTNNQAREKLMQLKY